MRWHKLEPKPSWDDAPEWAMWLTQEVAGYWRWWENEPEFNAHEDYYEAPGKWQDAYKREDLGYYFPDYQKDWFKESRLDRVERWHWRGWGKW